MLESLSYLTLQQYWWGIISLLGALLVFLLFVQGGQTLIYTAICEHFSGFGFILLSK